MSRQTVLLASLALSVGLNLFFVGGIGYRISKQRDFGDYGPRPIPPNVEWIVRDLPEQRREELAPLLQDNLATGRDARLDMFRAQRRINELMAADDFDADALATAFANLREQGLSYQELAHQQTVELFAALSQQERETALAFLQRRGPRGGPPPGSRDRNGKRGDDRGQANGPD